MPNGVFSRVFAPVNGAVNAVAKVASNVLRTGNSVVGSVGRGTRRALGHVTGAANTALKHVVTGKHRQLGGRRRSTKGRHTRKNKTRRHRK